MCFFWKHIHNIYNISNAVHKLYFSRKKKKKKKPWKTKWPRLTLNVRYKYETSELKESTKAFANLRESDGGKFLHYIFLRRAPSELLAGVSSSYFSKVKKKRDTRIRTSHSLARIFRNRTLKPTINPRPGCSPRSQITTNKRCRPLARFDKISWLRRRVIKMENENRRASERHFSDSDKNKTSRNIGSKK